MCWYRHHWGLSHRIRSQEPKIAVIHISQTKPRWLLHPGPQRSAVTKQTPSYIPCLLCLWVCSPTHSPLLNLALCQITAFWECHQWNQAKNIWSHWREWTGSSLINTNYSAEWREKSGTTAKMSAPASHPGDLHTWRRLHWRTKGAWPVKSRVNWVSFYRLFAQLYWVMQLTNWKHGTGEIAQSVCTCWPVPAHSPSSPQFLLTTFHYLAFSFKFCRYYIYWWGHTVFFWLTFYFLI